MHLLLIGFLVMFEVQANSYKVTFIHQSYHKHNTKPKT